MPQHQALHQDLVQEVLLLLLSETLTAQNITELYVQLVLTGTILDPATPVFLLILFAMLIVKMEPVLHAILVIQSTDKDA